jgi:hypothetical protein
MKPPLWQKQRRESKREFFAELRRVFASVDIKPDFWESGYP